MVIGVLVVSLVYTVLAQAHHIVMPEFTHTITGQVTPAHLVRHFPSAKVIRNTSMHIYFRPHGSLAPTTLLVARWTPPVIDGPCRVYEYTLPATGKTEFVTTQRWNSAALQMFCPGTWTCEIIVRNPAPPGSDEKIYQATVLAARRR